MASQVRVLIIALVCLLLVSLLFVILMSTSFSDVEYYEVCSYATDASRQMLMKCESFHFVEHG